MSKRIITIICCLLLGVSLLSQAGVNTMLATAAERTELIAFTFENKAEHESLFTVAVNSEIEWVNDAGIGKDDDTALKVTRIKGNNDYTSINNAVRLTFTEPLPAGAVYHISAWFYAPSIGNEGKDTLLGPALLLNGNTADNAFKIPSPDEIGNLPTDQWKEVSGSTQMMTEPLKYIDFRFYTNDKATHPELWYLDKIVISQIGETEKAPTWDLTLPSLKDTYKDYFHIGNIMEPHQTADNEITAMYNHHYNLVSSENSMKPMYLSSGKGSYNFSNADKLVNWAQANGILVHGHTLVWHSQSTNWVNKDANGNPLTRAEAKANLEEYINNVAGHFKGKVISWDVVNEAFHGGSSIPKDWKDALRKKTSNDSETSYWYLAYENGADHAKGESGADYIYDAFVFTRLADPDATLYYNDFNENESWKREAMAMMAEDLNNQWKTDPRNTQPDRLLVEVLGMQSHYWTSNLSISSIDATIARFIKAGVKVGITELDIPLGSYGNYTNDPTEENYQKQAQLYAQLFEVYKKYADDIERVTFWGKTDPQSWRSPGNPLLFDKLFSAKPAFHAVIDPEGFLNPTSAETEELTAPTPSIEATPIPTSDPSMTPNPDTIPTDTKASTSPNNLWIMLIVIIFVVVLSFLAVWYFIRKKKQNR